MTLVSALALVIAWTGTFLALPPCRWRVAAATVAGLLASYLIG